jgi:hypothetical protein
MFRVGLFACALVAACSKPAAQPSHGATPPSGLPPLGEEAPKSLVHANPDLPAGHPDLPAGHPAVGDPADEPAPIDPKQRLSGAIALAPKVKSRVAAGDVVFLSVRQLQDGLPGQILAVDRLEARDFPIPFVIDGSKAMVPGTAFSGKVIVTARLDKDGDAMTKNPGDVEGKKETQIPAQHVLVTLDTVLQ